MPAFLWNAGMVLHVLKSDPTLRDLKHIQVDGPGMFYLFFFDKQGCQRLTLEATHTMRTDVGEAFSEWISHSVHFAVSPMPLAEGWHHMMAASERHRQWSWVEYPGRPVLNLASSKSNSNPLLVGSVPSCHCKNRSSGRHRVWRGCKGAYKLPMRKASQAQTGKGVSRKLTPPSSTDRGGADSDGYSTVSEVPSGRHHRRRRQNGKYLAPMHLDMPIFKSTDPNADVTYTLWRFDVQGWLDQYQEESMMPHIYTSLQGYPGRWVCMLEEGGNITVPELLEHMDRAFSEMCDYNTMIRSLYEIRQKESESVEEYML